MNAFPEPLGGGDSLQQPDQRSALRLVEGGQELVLVARGQLLEPLQQLAAPRRQEELVGAPVGGVTAAFGEASLLEVVDQGHDGAPVHLQRLTQCLLGPTLTCSEMAEHAVVPRVQTERGEALGETTMSRRAELRQQKAGAAARASGANRRIRCDVTVSCHRSPSGGQCSDVELFRVEQIPAEEANMTVTVRYICDDVEAGAAFYRDHLGFASEAAVGGDFAALTRGELRLLLNRPGAGGAGQPTPDGRWPAPGGWNRIQIEVDDLEERALALRAAGVTLRSDVVTGYGGSQLLLDDPDGNPVELMQRASPGPMGGDQ